MIVTPETDQTILPVFTQTFLQFFFQFIGIRKIFCISHSVGSGHIDAVAQFRFIGEETQDRLAEIVFIMFVVFFIYGIDQDPTGFL